MEGGREGEKEGGIEGGIEGGVWGVGGEGAGGAGVHHTPQAEAVDNQSLDHSELEEAVGGVLLPSEGSTVRPSHCTRI
jgi:hypothetical protein